VTHPFRAYLDEANDPKWRPLWEQLYRAHFPGLDRVTPTPDGPGQRLGHDVVIRLRSGTEFRAEEKLRPGPQRWDDVLIEYETNGRRHGWIDGSYRTDYFAYLVAAVPWGLVVPWDALAAAWKAHGERWKAEYRRPHHQAANEAYTTLFVPVPVAELRRVVPTLRRHPLAA
jgi:hypothetical protein